MPFPEPRERRTTRYAVVPDLTLLRANSRARPAKYAPRSALGGKMEVVVTMLQTVWRKRMTPTTAMSRTVALGSPRLPTAAQTRGGVREPLTLLQPHREVGWFPKCGNGSQHALNHRRQMSDLSDALLRISSCYFPASNSCSSISTDNSRTDRTDLGAEHTTSPIRHLEP